MECNRDDAIKAAELAEKKYAAEDFTGAKKFCNKALQLFPGLERAKQLLAVVEVHSAAQVRIEGVEDWYGVLQVDPAASDGDIKKQYRKMALLLHPDKNRLVGAEPAFKLINEAWMVLSDKTKKSAYDVKRSEKTSEKPPPPPPPPPPETSNGCHEYTEQPSSSAANVPEASGGQATFWTQCPGCKIQYQYYRKFENYQLLCHRCKTGFIATDIGYPPAGSSMPMPKNKSKGANGANVNGVHDSSTAAFQQMQQRAKDREERKREDERRKAEREREREEKRKLREALKKAKEEDKRKEALEKQLLKQREREEKEARKRNMEALKKKLKRKVDEEEDEFDDDDDDDEDEDSDEERAVEDNVAIPPEILRFGLRRSNRTRKNVTYRDDVDDEDSEAGRRARMEESETSAEALQTRQELAERGKQLVLGALEAILKASTAAAQEAEEAKVRAAAQEAEAAKVRAAAQEAEAAKVRAAAQEAEAAKLRMAEAAEKEEKLKERECLQREEQAVNHPPKVVDSPSDGSDASGEEVSHYLVPDPDFHNFDKDRKEETVSEGQVWALYDDAEGMPRFYCEIKMVMSVNPFKVRIRWLERYEGLQHADEWERAGFAVTCGQFKCKRRTATEEHFNKFSHLMQVERQGNVFKIFPKSGEVWAIYRDWTSEWLEQGGKALKYEMVEVMASYFEETGMTVIPLVKVEGFKTIFARGGHLKTFQCKDLLRFSHKVPAHWMSGVEKENAPKDCWELDTAATPSHLIFKDR